MSASSAASRPSRSPRVPSFLTLTAASILLALASASPALAEDGNGASVCSNAGAPTGFDGDFDPFPNNPGEVAVWEAHTEGLSPDNNPGSQAGEIPPYVPAVIGCNPTLP
jgi:hypothetical protein